jgi:dipeptidyl aminopeptidase/acylaminoacyl peptidase
MSTNVTSTAAPSSWFARTLATFVGWLADEDLQVRGAQATRGDGGFDIRVREVGGEWRTLLSVGPEDASTGMVGFSGDGRRLFVISCVDADKVRLVEYELSTDRPRTIFEDAESDVEDLFSHRSTKDPIAVSSGRLRTRWTVLDEAYKADFEAIAKLHHGDPAVISRDHDDETWLLAFNTDDGPIPYYLYERASKTARLLFTSRPSLEGQPLAPMEPVEIPTRDGLSLPSYLTRPLKQSGPGPMVLVVHGGPWARDGWGYDPYHQWLANRGYAVFRSTSAARPALARTSSTPAIASGAGKMHDDLLDAVNWAVKEGADPRRTRSPSWAAATAATPPSSASPSHPMSFACGGRHRRPFKPRHPAQEHSRPIGSP